MPPPVRTNKGSPNICPCESTQTLSIMPSFNFNAQFDTKVVYIFSLERLVRSFA
jgi:hypothetical protein